MFCMSCGKEIKDHVSFCTSCGAPVMWAEEKKDDAPVVESAPVVEPAPEMPVSPAYQAAYSSAPAYNEPAPAAPKKKKSGKLPLIIMITVFAVCLIGAAVYCALLYKQCSDLSDTVDALQAENYDLAERNSELQADYDMLSDEYYDIYDQCDFFTEHAGICSDENDYYHTYTCPNWDRGSFRIYNTVYAENEGYEPCPYCH